MVSTSDTQNDLDGYEVLIAVTGGIAAFKTCAIVSELVQRGAGVTVAMTDAAQHFVTPLTFQALSGRHVLTSLWAPDNEADVQHISCTERADLFLVAPATANIIAKMANGLADDLVSTLVISSASAVVLAPAMNTRMWSNPAVQRNVSILKERGMMIVGPGEGWLACRTVGLGRMAEPAEIMDAVVMTLRTNPPKQGSPS